MQLIHYHLVPTELHLDLLNAISITFLLLLCCLVLLSLTLLILYYDFKRWSDLCMHAVCSNWVAGSNCMCNARCHFKTLHPRGLINFDFKWLIIILKAWPFYAMSH